MKWSSGAVAREVRTMWKGIDEAKTAKDGVDLGRAGWIV